MVKLKIKLPETSGNPEKSVIQTMLGLNSSGLSRLYCTLGQIIWDSFMLMNADKDLMNTIDSNDIFKKLIAKCTFNKLL
jgi:hypothetical protein